MNLKEYMEKLNEIVEKNPKALEMDVVHATDDEGNGFQKVHFAPGIGCYEDGEFDNESAEPNAVCIN